MSGVDSYKHNQPFSSTEENIVVIGAVNPSGNVARAEANSIGAVKTDPGAKAQTSVANIVTYSSVTTSGNQILGKSNTIRLLQIRNKLDQDLLISVDGGSTYPFYVDASVGNILLDAGTNGFYLGSSIFAKAVSANPTSGNVYVGAIWS